MLAAFGRLLCALFSSCSRPMVVVRLLDCILRFRRSSGCCLLVEVLVVSGVVGARCMRSCVNLICTVIHRCVFSSIFFSSSVIVHVLDAQRCDGVTLPSKSLSVSLSGYFGARECCSRTFDVVFQLDLYSVFEGDEFPRCWFHLLAEGSRCSFFGLSPCCLCRALMMYWR